MKTTALQLLLHQCEKLDIAWLDDFGERLPRQFAGWPVTYAGHLNTVGTIGQLREGAGVFNFNLVGVVSRRPQSHRNVIRDLIARDGNYTGVANRALCKNRDVAGSAADIDETYSKLFLVFGEHRIRRGKLLQNDFIHCQITALDALLYVLNGVNRACNQMNLRFESDAGHAERLFHAFLCIDEVFLGENV